MKAPLQILHLEDDRHDAELIAHTLKTAGIDCVVTVVHGRQGFAAALERGDIDLILSDFSLPDFDGLSAMEFTRANWPNVPLIIVSGTLGEERAIEALTSGA